MVVVVGRVSEAVERVSYMGWCYCRGVVEGYQSCFRQENLPSCKKRIDGSREWAVERGQ